MGKRIAIITARGGSKRIPKKNIKDFCGKPIIAYSIEAAISSELFDEVMVSTDSEEIADIARQYGAHVSFPPQWAFIIRDNALEYQYPENASARSQDLEPIYLDCGQFYVMKPKNVIDGIIVKKQLRLLCRSQRYKTLIR